MNEQEYQQAVDADQVSSVKPQETGATPQQQLTPATLDEFQPIISKLRMPRRHLTTAPTFTPKTFIDSIQFYDDGTNRRVYLYINGTWRYVALT